MPVFATLSKLDHPLLAIVLLVTGLMSAAAHAQELAYLKVKPLLCIIDERSDSCDMHFNLLWQTTVQGSYCLNDDIKTEPLSCWREQREGQHQEARVVKEPFRFLLTEAEDKKPLAEVRIDVMSTKTTDRRRKRSRRHVWSVL